MKSPNDKNLPDTWQGEALRVWKCLVRSCCCHGEISQQSLRRLLRSVATPVRTQTAEGRVGLTVTDAGLA